MKYLSPSIIKAVKKGNLSAVKRYLCTHKNNPQLLNACEERRREGMFFKGALTGTNGDGLAHLAIRFNRFDILALLVACPQMHFNTINTNGQTPLMLAVSYRKEEAIKILLKAEKININAADLNGDTALILAAKMGSLEIVKELLAHGALIGHKNSLGYTAFQEAEMFGHPDVAACIACRQPVEIKPEL